MEPEPRYNSDGPPMDVPLESRPGFSESEDFPVWSGGELVVIVVVLFLALFMADSLALLIANSVSGIARGNARALASDPWVAVPAQGVAYLATVGFIARVIKRHRRGRFLQAVHWRFPAKWLKFLLGGMILAVLIQALSVKLPIPKQMPIDQYFQSTSGAWMMAGFGTLVAPFCEELFFRGLLFPIVLRRIGMLAAVVVTAALFAFIHAAQLAHAWAAVSMLFVVGLVLTIVRARAHSLAASVLVHAGYNLALFALLYVGTAGFHDFTRLGQ
ncbi:MAG: CPBP family intramembrane glutamic endopeptidase [Candidatus Korobacteraceae bacterium]